MRSRFSFIILALTLTVLGSYWAQVAPPAEKERDHSGHTPKARLLLTFDPATVVSLEIRQGFGPAISVRRHGKEGWFLESPFDARADTYLVDRALTVLSLVSVAQKVPVGGSSLASFGLGEEGLTTRIMVETGDTRHWLELGGISANGAIRYARSSEQEEVVLIEKKSLQSLPGDAGALLDRRLFPLAQETLHTIQVKQRKGSMVLQAGGQGWMIVSPVRGKTDFQAMTEWLQRLAALNAASVHPSDPQTGKRPPASSIGSVRLAAGHVSGTTEFFRVGSTIIVRRSDQPSVDFEISPDMLPMVFPDPFGLRDKHLVHANVSQVALVEIHQEGRPDRLIRSKGGWTRNGKLLPDSQARAIEHWLTALHLAEGHALMRAPARCRMKATLRWKLTLRSHDGPVLDHLELARTHACGDLATFPSGEWVQLQTTDLVDQIPAEKRL